MRMCVSDVRGLKRVIHFPFLPFSSSHHTTLFIQLKKISNANKQNCALIRFLSAEPPKQ